VDEIDSGKSGLEPVFAFKSAIAVSKGQIAAEYPEMLLSAGISR
jgi:hypothetical protein